MKKKLMMGALLFGAITLASCVDDNESASVTAVRQAKAEYLSAQAAAAKTNAEANLIQANADAAYKAAQAEFQKAQAASTAVSTADREFSLQKAKDEYARELERIEAKAQEDLAKQQVALITAQQNLDAALKGEDAVKAGAMKTAFGTYTGELTILNNYKKSLITKKASLAKVEAGIISAEAAQQANILASEKNIADAEAILAVYNDPAYADLDANTLSTQAAAKNIEYAAQVAKFDKSEETKAYLDANNAYYDAVKAAVEATEVITNTDGTGLNDETSGLLKAQFGEYVTTQKIDKATALSLNDKLNNPISIEGFNTIVGETYVSRTFMKDVVIDKAKKFDAEKKLATAVDTKKVELGVEKDSASYATIVNYSTAAGIDITTLTTNGDLNADQTAYGILTWAKAQLAEATDTLAKNKKNYEAAVTAQKAAQKAYDDAKKAQDNLPATATAAERTAAANAVIDAQAVLQGGTKTDGTVIALEKSANGVLQTEGVSLKGSGRFTMPGSTSPENFLGDGISSPKYTDGTELAVGYATKTVYAAEELVEKAKKALADAEEKQAKFAEALEAFDVDAYNKLIAAVEEAEEAMNDAKEAWEEAAKPIAAVLTEANTLTFMANNSSLNLPSLIAAQEKIIADEKENIAGYKDNSTAEAAVETAKADIEKLEAQIEAQQKVVDAYKAAFDALVAEETAAE